MGFSRLDLGSNIVKMFPEIEIVAWGFLGVVCINHDTLNNTKRKSMSMG